MKQKRSTVGSYLHSVDHSEEHASTEEEAGALNHQLRTAKEKITEAAKIHGTSISPLELYRDLTLNPEAQVKDLHLQAQKKASEAKTRHGMWTFSKLSQRV